MTNADRVRGPVPGPVPVGADEAAGEYISPEHLSASRWVALPQCFGDGSGRDSWQDVSVRPEGSRSGFTIEVATAEVLEADFEEGEGPHPRELLPPGDGFGSAATIASFRRRGGLRTARRASRGRRACPGTPSAPRSVSTRGA